MSSGEAKKFVINRVYTDVKKLQHGVWHEEEEKHFGFEWKTAFMTQPGAFDLKLQCKRDVFGREWSMDTQIEFVTEVFGGSELFRKNCKFSNKKSSSRLLKHEAIENYIADGNFSIKLYVTINGIEKAPRKILRSFDVSSKEFSDVVLVVKDQKFYVLKSLLASHSDYFKTLLFGNFNEFKQSEVELNDIEPDDFQNFLELIHGEPVVDGDTLPGILKLADYFGSATAFRQCERFLLIESKLNLESKLQLATKYKLEELMNKCIPEIKTVDEISSFIPVDPNQIGNDVWKKLLSISIDLSKKK